MNLLRFGVWSGLVFNSITLTGWLIVANMFPLHLPSAGAEVISAFFAENATAVKWGMIILWVGLIFFAFFIATVAVFILKVQHEASLMLAIAHVIGASFVLLAVLFSTFMWVVIAFRPDRSPDVIYVLNDLAWIALIAPFWCAFTQFLCVGMAAFVDKTPTPVFPRWYGYIALWTAFLSIPGGLTVVFYSGPFAWNGILGFWVPAVATGIVLCATTYVFLQVLKKEESAGLASATV